MDEYKIFVIGIAIIALLQLVIIIICAGVKYHRRKREQLTQSQTQPQYGMNYPLSVAVINGNTNVSTSPPPYQLCQTFSFPSEKGMEDFDHLPTYNEAISIDFQVISKS